MAPTRVGSPDRRLRFAIVALVLAIGVPVVIAIASVRPAPSSSPVPGSAAAAAAAAMATPEQVDCRRETGPLPPYLAGDPCPSAILAVEDAVAGVRLPIKRMVILFGPLFCDVIWEGFGSPRVCFGPMIRFGQYMHAYVSFVESTKVAVVMLGLDLPSDDNDPLATRPPWQTTLLAVAVPPDGWVMP